MAAKKKKATFRFKLTSRGPAAVAGKQLRGGCPRKLLDPIEIASRDEIAALQTRRLKWTLAHAYKNVPIYRKKFDDAGVHPSDFRRLEDLAIFPLHHQGRPAQGLPVRHVRDPAREMRAHPCLVGHHGQADGRGLQPGRHRELGKRSSRVRSALPAGCRATSCMSLTATGCSPAVWARTTAARRWAAR